MITTVDGHSKRSSGIINYVLKRILTAISSPKFFIGVVILFILQGTFFAIAVNPSDIHVTEGGTVTRGGGVVPDGNRHIGAIYYYAQQPIQNGPFIDDMTDSELWMGDLERFPSYFYYYLLSFIMRIPLALDVPDIVNVMIIRFVGLIFGVLTLIVFRKVVSLITKSRKIQNLSTLALAVTGSFAWLAPAENYDILSLLFFLLFMLASIRLFVNKDPRQIYFMAIWLFIGSITKYTYLPFMGLFGVMAVVLYIRSIGGVRPALSDATTKIKKYARSVNKGILAALVVVLLVSGGLFVERIGGNLVMYQSISMDSRCHEIHSVQACRNFGVYERGYQRELAIKNGADQDFSFNIFVYIGYWLDRYYTSMYAYVGHIWIYQFSPIMYIGMAIAVLSVIGMAIFLKLKRVVLFPRTVERFAVISVVTLVAAQFLYNMDTYLSTLGRAYAHQGRYLLPAIGLAYVLMLIIVAKFYGRVSKRQKPKVAALLVAVGVIVLLSNMALVTFFMYADSPEWFIWG
jgi:hypothetical protein